MTGYQYVLSKKAQMEISEFEKEVTELVTKFFNKTQQFPGTIGINFRLFPEINSVLGYKIIRKEHYHDGTILLVFAEPEQSDG